MGEPQQQPVQPATDDSAGAASLDWIAPPPYQLPPVGNFFPRPDYRPDAPLCFLHLTKTAGTSIRLTIENAFAGERVFPNGSQIYRGGYLEIDAAQAAGDDLTRFDLVGGHNGSRQLRLMAPDANSFIWFREPFDRLLSEFFFLIVQRAARPRNDFHRRVNNEPLEPIFMDWVRAWPEGGARQAGQLIGVRYGRDFSIWQKQNPGVSLVATALEVVRRSFFIGLVEDHERSLNYLAALTGILPPRQVIRHNVGRRRHLELNLTAEQQAEVSTRIAPDIAFHELMRGIYRRQLEQLDRMAGGNALLGLCHDRQALRTAMLERHAASDRWRLGSWTAWDPVLAENMDGREQATLEGEQVRWRWTGPLDEALFYFSLPASSDLEIELDLYGATPMTNIRAARLLVNDTPVPLSLISGNRHGHRLVGVIPAGVASSRPGTLAEFRLQTPVMTDESTINPAAARKLGLALQRIAVAPATPWPRGLRRLFRRSATR